MSDLPELVDQHLTAAGFPDDRVCGWEVHRNLEDGSAAVTFRAGGIGGRDVRSQSLERYRFALVGAGFTVDAEDTWPEQDDPADGALLWLHVTGFAAAAEAVGAA